MFETLLESRRVSTGRSGRRRAGALSLAAHTLVTAWAASVWTLGPDDTAPSDDAGERAAGYSTLRFARLAVPTVAVRTDARASAARRRPTTFLRADRAATAAPAAVDVAAIADSVVQEIARRASGSGEIAGRPRVADFAPTAGGGGLAEAIARSLNFGRRGDPFVPETEYPAMALADNPIPEYPEALLAAGVEGEVRVRFVIDTTGALDPHSIRVMASTNEQFTRAVRAVLPRLRFLPAVSGGTKVRTLSEQSFAFVVVPR